MKTVQEKIQRVQCFVEPRLRRVRELFATLVEDRRNSQGIRHVLPNCLLALLAGLLACRMPLRDVEKLSAELGLGRRGKKISDGCLTSLLKGMGEHDVDKPLVQMVRDMSARGQMKTVGFLQAWTAIDGKYTILKHNCGGFAQKFVEKGRTYFRLGVLRAVQITAAAKPALGQWAMPPVPGKLHENKEKQKHTGETTNLLPFIAWLREQYVDLTRNFTLDAGLWSKQIFLELDAAGFGVFAGLKGNKPELFSKAVHLLYKLQATQEPHAESKWEPYQNGHVRRRLWRTTRLENWNGWIHLRQVIVVEQTKRDKNGKEDVELRYFVTNKSTDDLTPRQILLLVRLHWGIENDCNWSFDMQFGEDDGVWCTKNKATLVLGVLRMIAYNYLQWLRKKHVREEHPRAPSTPLPWRDLFDLLHRYLTGVGLNLLKLIVRPPGQVLDCGQLGVADTAT